MLQLTNHCNKALSSETLSFLYPLGDFECTIRHKCLYNNLIYMLTKFLVLMIMLKLLKSMDVFFCSRLLTANCSSEDSLF